MVDLASSAKSDVLSGSSAFAGHGMNETVLGFPVTRTTQPQKRPTESRLGFGRYLTDHVFVAEHDGKQWSQARIVPMGTTHIDLAAGAVQYGLSIFEGMKAFHQAGSSLRLFRPDAHARRFQRSAKRLC